MKLTRGQTVIFSKILKDSNGIVVKPSSPVQARVLDLFGNIVAQGPSYKNIDTGNYDYRFVVPPEAAFSTVDSPWTIDWSFTDNFGATVNLVMDFDVVEDDDELPERTLILTEKSKDVIEFMLPERANSFTFEIIDEFSRTYFQTSNSSDFEITASLKGYVYTLNFDTSVLPLGDYIVRVYAKLPSYRRTYSEVIIARVVPNYFWFYYNSLQTLLDKARKPGHLIQSYTTSDMFEYLHRGMAMLNLVPPQATNWTFEYFPNGRGLYKAAGLDISHYLICAAAVWGLQAQIVMYGELGFTFSGQTITLEHDPSTALGGEIETLLNVVNEQFPKAKEMLIRSTQAIAFTGVRRMFYNQNLSRVDTLRRGLDMQMNLLNTRIQSYYVV